LIIAGRYFPAPRGRGRSAPQFLAFLSIYAYTLYIRLSRLTWERGLVLGVSHAPPQRSGPQHSPFLGVHFHLCIYVFILCIRTTEFDVVTHVEEGRVSSGQPHLSPQDSRIPGLPNFGGSSIFISTPFNAERPNSAW